MAINREKELYAPIIAGMLAERWAMFRIEDGSYGRKPFDCTGIAPDGRAVGLEVKLVDQYIGAIEVPWANCSIHQRHWLKEYAKLGGLALLVIYTPNQNKLFVIKLDTDGENFTHFEMVLDKCKHWSGWSQLLE